MTHKDETATAALAQLAQQQGDLIEQLIVDVSALTTFLAQHSWFDRAEYARVREATQMALAGLHRTGQIPSVELLIAVLRRDPGAPS